MRLLVRLTPRAREDRLLGLAPGAEGGKTALRAAVTAPAQEGRANEALLRLLAREWRLPRRDLAILAGAASRTKLVGITGDPRKLMAEIGPVIAALAAR